MAAVNGSSGQDSMDPGMREDDGEFQREDDEDGGLKLIVRLPPEREGAFTARFPQAERQG